MSMIGNYLLVSPAQLDELLADPESISGFLYPEDDAPPPEDRSLDIDKAWQLIHFLLTGDDWAGEPPLRNACIATRCDG